LSRFLNESVYARHRRSQTKGPASCGASSIRENRAAVLPAPRQNGGDHWRCIAVSGGGNCHDRAKAPSKPGRENVAAPFQSIGFRGSPVSTLIVLPMTSVAPLEAGGHNLQNPRALCSLVGRDVAVRPDQPSLGRVRCPDGAPVSCPYRHATPRFGDQSEFTPFHGNRTLPLVLSTMIGAMTLARIVADPDLSSEILDRAKEHLHR
jgi:hypothetical protein